MSTRIALTQTITRNGKFYLEGYVPYGNGGNQTRQFFSISEMTRDEAFARLYAMQAEIDKMHPRRNDAK